jgi:Signal peptidase subunit
VSWSLSHSLLTKRNTEHQPLNQVILWDKIVKSKEEAHLKFKNEFVKYALIDQGSELR